MSGYKNWPISTGRAGIPMVASSAGTATLIAAPTDINAQQSEDIMIDNPGPADVFVIAGNAGTVATANCFRIPANSLQPVRKDQMTHLALYCASGTQNVVVHIGAGA